MNKIFKILIFISIALIDLTLMPIFSVNGIFPNIVLIGALTFALTDYEEEAYLLAAVGGIVLDLGSSMPFGLNTIILVSLVYLVRLIITKYLPEINVVLLLIMIFIFSSVFALIVNLLLSRFYGYWILIDGFYSAVLGLIFFLQLHRFHGQSQIKMEGKFEHF